MKTKTVLGLLLSATFCLIAAACSSNGASEIVESNELYRIQVGGKHGYINEKGELVIEPQFNNAYWFFGDGVCYAEAGERKGLINLDGEFVAETDTSVNWVLLFKHGAANFYANNQKMGIINTLGEIVLPAIYKNVKRDGDDGYIVEDSHGNFGYANNQGELIVPCQYDAVNGFREGLMVVATSNKCGYVDTTGAWVIDTIYDDARGFGDGLARVKVGGKWQFIDHAGNVAEGLECDEPLTGFSCNRAFVKRGGKIELIDKKGTTLAEIEADSVFGYSEGYEK